MTLRSKLVATALEWESIYGVMPAITSAIAEYDAAILVGMKEDSYGTFMQARTAVSKGFDFQHNGKQYQVKANRPSGKPGSTVTLVGKPKNYDWDLFVWIRYDPQFVVQEAWLWDREEFQNRFSLTKRLSPDQMRLGTQLV